MLNNKFTKVAFYLGSVVMAYGCGASNMKHDLQHVTGEIKKQTTVEVVNVSKPAMYECRDYTVKVNGKTTVDDTYEDGMVSIVVSGDRKSFISRSMSSEVQSTLVGEHNGIYKYIGPSGDDYLKFTEFGLARESELSRFVGDVEYKTQIVANCYLSRN